MAKMTKVWRVKPEERKSLVFEISIFSGSSYSDAGEYAGEVICKNTRQRIKFGSYHREKANILQFIDKLYEEKLRSWRKMADLRIQLCKANKELRKLKGCK